MELVDPPKKLNLSLATITFFEVLQPGRQRFCLLVRTLDDKEQGVPIVITGPMNALYNGKYQITIPSKTWGKVENRRLKNGYSKRATLDIANSTLYNCAPNDIAKYSSIVIKLCRDHEISTKEFIKSCPLAYLLLGEGAMKLVSDEDIHPNEYKPKLDLLF